MTFTETGVRDVTWDSSNINAQLGETMTMKDCWFAAYIKSANEVCAQIAEYVGGTEANFVEMMNQKAKKLGMHAYTFCKCERSSGRKPLFLRRRSCEDHAGRT